MVETPEQAAALVFETKYAPIGGRGFSNSTRAGRYGAVPAIQHAEESNRETLLIVQIETKAALERAPEIAAVPGVDMIFIGPADLSQSLGFPGQAKAPEVVEAITRCITSVRDLLPVGITAFSSEEVRFWRERGATSILTASTSPIRQAFEQMRRDFQAHLKL
jgi:4-hydroxy-2-oxoheptanedioate aldolase